MTSTAAKILVMDCSFHVCDKSCLELCKSVRAAKWRSVCKGLYQKYHQRYDAVATSAQEVLLATHSVRVVWSADDDECPILPLLESMNENCVNVKELGRSHRDGAVFHVSRAIFVVSRIEAAAFHIKNSAMSIDFHATEFYRFTE